MNCPQCNNEYFCPCAVCRKQNPDDPAWIEEVNDLDWYIICPKCGLRKHAEEWQQIEFDQKQGEGK